MANVPNANTTSKQCDVTRVERETLTTMTNYTRMKHDVKTMVNLKADTLRWKDYYPMEDRVSARYWRDTFDYGNVTRQHAHWFANAKVVQVITSDAIKWRPELMLCAVRDVIQSMTVDTKVKWRWSNPNGREAQHGKGIWNVEEASDYSERGDKRTHAWWLSGAFLCGHDVRGHAVIRRNFYGEYKADNNMIHLDTAYGDKTIPRIKQCSGKQGHVNSGAAERRPSEMILLKKDDQWSWYVIRVTWGNTDVLSFVIGIYRARFEWYRRETERIRILHNATHARDWIMQPLMITRQDQTWWRLQRMDESLWGWWYGPKPTMRYDTSDDCVDQGQQNNFSIWWHSRCDTQHD